MVDSYNFEKSNGPSTELCGTPDITGVVVHEAPSTTTY